MSVYERNLEGNDLALLIEDFTKRPDFQKIIQRIAEEHKGFKPQSYSESKGFEVITTVESDKDEGTLHELTLYLKYKEDVIIRTTEIKAKNEKESSKDRSLFSVNADIKKVVNEKEVIEKIALDDGEITFNDTIETDDSLDVFAIPTYLEVSKTSEGISLMASPVPCFNWDGSGTCCKFRYKGLPWNPVVTYKWCGAKCGNGCGSTPTPVNALDRCCQSHDCCYVRNSSYPARCNCDQALINCARKTDNAGSDRVVVAFQAKMLFFGC